MATSSLSKASRLINILLVVTKIVLETLNNVRDMYGEIFFVVPALTLFLISSDFQAEVEKQAQLCKSPQNGDMCSKTVLVKQYMEICRLSRTFNRASGKALFWYFFLYLMYYSIGMDRLLLPETPPGEKLYDLQFVCTFVSVFGLCVLFSLQVSSI